jgi:peptide/nickel transport system substrate-binding protein
MSTQRAPLVPDGGLSRRRFLGLTGLGAAAATGALPTLAAAAGRGSSPATAARRGGIIRLGNTADITTFQPYLVGDNATIWNVVLIYDQLTRPSPDGLSVEPSLAQSWDISADGKTYTFHLRRGIRFHDGSPLTADDVKYCVEQAAFAKDTLWGFLFGAFKGMDVVDQYTVRAHLHNAHAPFLADMALFACSVYPKKLAGKQLWQHPIGTGPFKFVSWTRGSELVLARNPDFWRHNGRPYIDEFHNMVVPDANTRALQVQSGELEIAVYVAPSSAKALMGNPAVTVHIDPFMESHFTTLNISLSDPPLNNKLVRQALNYAIDKNAIVQHVLFGFAKPSGQALPPMFGYDPSIQPYPYNPTKAKASLAQAGYANGFSFKVLVQSSIATDMQVATLMQEQLAQVGVKMSIQVMEASVEGAIFSGSPPFKYQAAMNTMSADIVDPDELVNYAVRGDGGQYAIFTTYNNPLVNKLAQQGGEAPQPAQRRRLYYQMERIHHDDAPFIFLYSINNISLTGAAVQGFKPLPTGNYRLEDVWLKG